MVDLEGESLGASSSSLGLEREKGEVNEKGGRYEKTPPRCIGATVSRAPLPSLRATRLWASDPPQAGSTAPGAGSTVSHSEQGLRFNHPSGWFNRSPLRIGAPVQPPLVLKSQLEC